MARIDEWLGFDIPEDGTEDHDMWMSKLHEVEQIHSLQDVIDYVEYSMGRDFAEFIIEGEHDLVAAGMNPLKIPGSVVVNLGSLLEHDEEKTPQHCIYEYGGQHFVIHHDAITVTHCFDTEREALQHFGIDVSLSADDLILGKR